MSNCRIECPLWSTPTPLTIAERNPLDVWEDSRTRTHHHIPGSQCRGTDSINSIFTPSSPVRALVSCMRPFARTALKFIFHGYEVGLEYYLPFRPVNASSPWAPPAVTSASVGRLSERLTYDQRPVTSSLWPSSSPRERCSEELSTATL